MAKLSRRTFLQTSAGVTTGAVIAGTPLAAVAGAEAAPAEASPATVIDSSATAPREPVMAYVRDAQAGEVTVLAGVTETTFHDPGLARRLLGLAPEHDQSGQGGN